MKKAIITGATSTIGLPLTRLLLDSGFYVLAVCRNNSQTKNKLPNSSCLKIIECNLEEILTLPELTDIEFDYFFHLAWNGVSQTLRDNTVMQSQDIVNTLNAVNSAKKMGCKKFIGVGSQAEVGITHEKIGCNPVCNPVTPYGVAKFAAGKLSGELCKQLGMEYNWARIISAYCENDHSYTMISNLVQRLICGLDCDLSDGTQIWDYLHVFDVAKAIYLICEKGVDGKIYPIGSGEERPLKDYIIDIYNAVGNNTAKLNFGAIPFHENSIRYLCADIEELKSDTGFMQTISFKEGIKRVVESARGKNEN